MRIAIVGAGFTPAEADALRRAMATFRRGGEIGRFRDKFLAGMAGRGYQADFAARCFKQIEGFADYGFPESHAASFALLVYVSAWLKCHYPAAFACALLNSQPMGFYAPAQIVRDARQHDVAVRPVDVNHSRWDCTLEPDDGPGGQALRLGFRRVKGLGRAAAEALTASRGNGYREVGALCRRAGLGKAVIERLARADAFASMGLNRRRALWAARGLDEAPLPLFATIEEDGGRHGEGGEEAAVALPAATPGQQVADDYRALGLSLKAHPLALLRGELDGYVPCADLDDLAHGKRVRVAGLVTARQRPGSAKGVIFITLEDESGIANLVIRPSVFERCRKAVAGGRLLGATGRVQREGRVIHVVADRLRDLTGLLGHLDRSPGLGPPSGSFPRLAVRHFR